MYNVLISSNFPVVGIGISNILPKAIPDQNISSKVCSLSQINDIVDATNAQMLILDLYSIPDLQVFENAFNPGHMEIVSQQNNLTPLLKIIVIYEKMDQALFEWLYLKGVKGFVKQDSSVKDIQFCVEKVYMSEVYIDSKLSLILADMPKMQTKANNHNKRLTKREKLIAMLLVEGKKNAQICSILKLRPSTVSTIKSHVFKKLQVVSLVELVKINNTLY